MPLTSEPSLHPLEILVLNVTFWSQVRHAVNEPEDLVGWKIPCHQAFLKITIAKEDRGVCGVPGS